MRDILDQMRRSLAADRIITDVATVCAQYGVRCTSATGGETHCKISHPSQRDILTVPRAHWIKPVHTRRLVKFTEAAGGVDAPS
jgi:hypothetical protein